VCVTKCGLDSLVAGQVPVGGVRVVLSLAGWVFPPGYTTVAGPHSRAEACAGGARRFVNEGIGGAVLDVGMRWGVISMPDVARKA